MRHFAKTEHHNYDFEKSNGKMNEGYGHMRKDLSERDMLMDLMLRKDF